MKKMIVELPPLAVNSTFDLKYLNFLTLAGNSVKKIFPLRLQFIRILNEKSFYQIQLHSRLKF